MINLIPIFICSFQIIGFGLLNMIYLYGFPIGRDNGLRTLGDNDAINRVAIEPNSSSENISLYDFVHTRFDSMVLPAKQFDMTQAQTMSIREKQNEFFIYNRSISQKEIGKDLIPVQNFGEWRLKPLLAYSMLSSGI